MPTSRTPKHQSRTPHRRSRSHVSPERRQRRRTHSHSPVRRHARSPTCRHNRGRSPSRHAPRTSRVPPQALSTLATCSTIATYSTSTYAHRRHRDIEESSVTRLIVDRGGSSEDEENRENRRRVIERSETYADGDDDNLKEKTFQERICKAAKVVSGFLIAMGLILVFYVIITTILGESTPLDIFNFEYEKEEILSQDTKAGNQEIKIELPNLTLDITGLQSADLVTDEPEAGNGELILSRKDYDETYDEETDERYSFYDAESESGVSSLANGTTDKDAEGRSYIAYIPVPLNNEEEEEDEEEEEKDKEEKHSSNTKPFFVPVMIMPGGGMSPNGGMNPNGGMSPNGRMNPNRMSHLNLGPNRPLPPLLHHPQPNRGVPRISLPPIHQRKPSLPIPPIGNIPGMPPNVPKGLPNSLLQMSQNNARNRFPGSALPLPPLSPVQNPNIPGNMNIPGHMNIPNVQHNSQGGLMNNAAPFQGNGNSGNPFINGNNRDHNQNNGNLNRFPITNGNTNLNDGHYNGFGNSNPNAANPFNNLNNGNFQNGVNRFTDNIPSNGNTFRPNNGGNRISNGNGLSIGNPTNDPNRMNLPNSAGIPSGKGSSSNEIWSSLFEILKRRSGTAVPFSSSGSTGRMNSGGIPSHFGPLSRRESTPNPPPVPQSESRLRPRLLPKSRSSGPLPRPFPRYRYRLPPIPPPPGMPIVPRRPPPPPRPMPKPPKDFQYPKDSTSIQDIIKFMKDREKIQQNGNTGIDGQVTYGPNGDFTIGDQNHIIGENIFGDPINEYSNSEGPISFGNDPVSGHNGPGSGNNYGGRGNQGNTHMTFGGGGVAEYNNGGDTFDSGGNYNNGGSNFNNGNNHNYGNNPSHSGNNVNLHNNNPNQGSSIYTSGGNNFNKGNNYGTGGNSYNSGENNFNNGGNNYNNGGNNYNSGGNSYSNGGSSFNNGGNFGGGRNPGSNTNSPSSGKSRPFNIMLDVYPMEVSPSSSGSKPFQTSISFDNDRYSTGQNQYGGYNDHHGSSNNAYNTGYQGNDGRNRYSLNNNNGRFTQEDDANKHEIVLHLNLFSKTPSKFNTNGRNGGNTDFSGRAGAVSLEIPLTGQLSPLDIYKALMARVRSEKPQAQVQHRPGLEEKKDSEEKDDVEIELFDVEEGPRLLDAIEQGLRKLNKDLPPDKRFRIDEESPSVIDLYEAVNGNPMVTPFSPEEFLANHNHNATYSHPNYNNGDEYLYYDYYEYQDDVAEKDKKATQSSTTTSLASDDLGHHEQLPTPCAHRVDHDD